MTRVISWMMLSAWMGICAFVMVMAAISAVTPFMCAVGLIGLAVGGIVSIFVGEP